MNTDLHFDTVAILSTGGLLQACLVQACMRPVLGNVTAEIHEAGYCLDAPAFSPNASTKFNLQTKVGQPTLLLRADLFGA